MDGLTRVLAKPAHLSPLIGILYAEDFDDSPNGPATQPGPTAEAEPPPLTQDDVDRACAAAVATARLHWQDEGCQLRTALLGQIATVLATARDAAERIAADTAEAAAKTVLALLSGALPHFCDQHGDAEARAIVDHLLPMLRSEPRIVIRVHPALASELQQEFASREADFTGKLTVLPADLAPGDIKIEWENGSLSRETSRILQAMQDVLGQLGLQQPQETTPQRRLAHAE